MVTDYRVPNGQGRTCRPDERRQTWIETDDELGWAWSAPGDRILYRRLQHGAGGQDQDPPPSSRAWTRSPDRSCHSRWPSTRPSSSAPSVTPRVCFTKPPTETPNTTSFIEVDEPGSDGKGKRVFSGWLFASSPGLRPQHGLRHLARGLQRRRRGDRGAEGDT